MEIICFIAGILFFYKQNIILYLFLIFCLIFRPVITGMVAFLLGLYLCFLHNYLHKPFVWPSDFSNQVFILHGKVVSIPKVTANGMQFVLKPFEIFAKHGTQRSLFGKRTDFSQVLVNCYQNCGNIGVGDNIQAAIKLRKPRNYLNPGGFDYVGFLQSRHIFWLGSCKNIEHLKVGAENNTNNKLALVNSFIAFIGRRLNNAPVRSNLKTRLENSNLTRKAFALVTALSVGITNYLSEDDWGLFRRTGTIHLLVISGAHIGFVSGLIFGFVNYVWSRSPKLSLFMPSLRVASIGAISIACVYSWLAGFSVSVQRALIACIVVLSRNFLQIRFNSWQAWRLALFVCLLYEPHYVLYPGFFLSFLAVAILFVTGKYFRCNKLMQTVILQLACLLGLLPLTLYWFGYTSINGFFANLVAIPVVSLVIVPLALIYLLLTNFVEFGILTKLLNHSIDFLYWYLEYIDKNISINIDWSVSIYFTMCLILMILIVLVYPIKALRVAFFSLLCAFVLPKSHKIKVNQVVFDVLDVGQGLSVLIRTAQHVILYDTGGKFYRGKDLGQLVIVPYLKNLNIKKLDMVIVSHPDLDHRGGLNSIEKSFNIEKLVVNDPSFYQQAENCHTYPSWIWDGVEFKFLPILGKLSKKNNDSCVLVIQGYGKRFLIPGDIEKDAERYLVANYPNELSAKYLLVPHHGSKTSSSAEFLRAVNPDYAIFAYGYQNKYSFPNLQVVARYNKLGIKTLHTALDGMITINFKSL